MEPLEIRVVISLDESAGKLISSLVKALTGKAEKKLLETPKEPEQVETPTKPETPKEEQKTTKPEPKADIPTTTLTEVDARKAVNKVREANVDINKVKALLKEFRVGNVSALKPEDIPLFIQKVEGLINA